MLLYAGIEPRALHMLIMISTTNESYIHQLSKWSKQNSAGFSYLCQHYTRSRYYLCNILPLNLRYEGIKGKSIKKGENRSLFSAPTETKEGRVLKRSSRPHMMKGIFSTYHLRNSGLSTFIRCIVS